EFHGWAHALDGTNAPVRGRDDEPFAQGRDARRVAEKVGDPRGREYREPGQRRPQQKQQQRDAGADGGEIDAKAMDGHEGLADGIDEAMTLGHAISPGDTPWSYEPITGSARRGEVHHPTACAARGSQLFDPTFCGRCASLYRYGDEPEAALAVLKAQEHGLAAGLLHLVD